MTTDSDDRPVIEITEEMIEAGVSSWVEWSESDDAYPQNLVRQIFLSMMSRSVDRGKRDQERT